MTDQAAKIPPEQTLPEPREEAMVLVLGGPWTEEERLAYMKQRTW